MVTEFKGVAAFEQIFSIIARLYSGVAPKVGNSQGHTT